MCERMTHRGPDSEGLMVQTGVALGMRRLAIIDLQTGEQPALSEDGSSPSSSTARFITIASCALDLEERGHQFRSASDTEVLPHLYEEYGTGMVEHLERHVRLRFVGRASSPPVHRA